MYLIAHFMLLFIFTGISTTEKSHDILLALLLYFFFCEQLMTTTATTTTHSIRNKRNKKIIKKKKFNTPKKSFAMAVLMENISCGIQMIQRITTTTNSGQYESFLLCTLQRTTVAIDLNVPTLIFI